MTVQQYEELSGKIEQYRNLGIQIDRLKNERSQIEVGVLGISCYYQIYISCGGRYDEFRDNLQKVLIQFYDDEIDRLKKLQEDIKV